MLHYPLESFTSFLSSIHCFISYNSKVLIFIHLSSFLLFNMSLSANNFDYWVLSTLELCLSSN
uniref:Uncharacterized protein n=1 Tax=Rhizophora mucronata TaxID=61149 RepID=A0A2P2Q5J6_RHIMU